MKRQYNLRLDDLTRARLKEMSIASERTASQFIRYLINREYTYFQDDAYRRGLATAQELAREKVES